MASYPCYKFLDGFIWFLFQSEELTDIHQLVLGLDAAELEQRQQVLLAGLLVSPGVVALPGQLVGDAVPQLVGDVLAGDAGGPLVALPPGDKELPVGLRDPGVEGGALQLLLLGRAGPPLHLLLVPAAAVLRPHVQL